MLKLFVWFVVMTSFGSGGKASAHLSGRGKTHSTEYSLPQENTSNKEGFYRAYSPKGKRLEESEEHTKSLRHSSNRYPPAPAFFKKKEHIHKGDNPASFLEYSKIKKDHEENKRKDKSNVNKNKLACTSCKMHDDLKGFKPPAVLREVDLKAKTLDQEGRALLEGILAKSKTKLDTQIIKHTKNQGEKAKAKGTLYIFISLNLHKEILATLFNQAKRFGGVLVLRGLKNNSWRETLEIMLPLIEEYQGGIILDPILFKRYSVTKVPTILVSREDRSSLSQDPKALDGQAEPKSYDKIAGNISIKYALEEFNKKGDLKHVARTFLERCDG